MAFREMRRHTQQLGEAECEEILAQATHGVLAVMGDDGYPYAVPMSFVYRDGTVFLHAAKVGHKIEAIRRCDKVSFAVVAQDDVVPEEYATRYRSVILFGRAAVLEDEKERFDALMALGRRYAPGADARTEQEVAYDGAAAAVIAIRVEHMTGKRAKKMG